MQALAVKQCTYHAEHVLLRSTRAPTIYGGYLMKHRNVVLPENKVANLATQLQIIVQQISCMYHALHSTHAINTGTLPKSPPHHLNVSIAACDASAVKVD
jgi:hypothetical protein